MIHRQQIVQSGPTSRGFPSDVPRTVIQTSRHDDVVHRVLRLRVKNGALQVLSHSPLPPLFAAK